MIITLNGTEHQIAEGTNIQQLLQELGIQGPVAVEHNRRVCPKKEHARTQLNPGDILEIVTIVGGG